MSFASDRSGGEWKPIVHSPAQVLLASDVAFCRLYGSMAEQELDLFQFASGGMAQAGARPAIMPHAALSPLCRIPDYAESISRPPMWRVVSEFARESDSA
jgi:hypothetical protein